MVRVRNLDSPTHTPPAPRPGPRVAAVPRYISNLSRLPLGSHDLTSGAPRPRPRPVLLYELHYWSPVSSLAARSATRKQKLEPHRTLPSALKILQRLLIVFRVKCKLPSLMYKTPRHLILAHLASRLHRAPKSC